MVHPHAVCAEISRGLPQLPVARPGRYGSRAGTLVMTDREHRHWRARVGHRTPARLRRRDRAAVGRRPGVDTKAAWGHRSSCRRRANGDAVQGADAVVLALRFAVLRSVVEELTQPLVDRLVVVPSNPLGTDA